MLCSMNCSLTYKNTVINFSHTAVVEKQCWLLIYAFVYHALFDLPYQDKMFQIKNMLWLEDYFLIFHFHHIQIYLISLIMLSQFMYVHEYVNWSD